jgi:oxygen-independent coproporphyrinogen-3 oxidase
VKTLGEFIEEGAFQAYAYAYPHKTAYRPLDPAIPLEELWSQEDKSALFLYVHLPFCEMRCGFCNLFAMTNPEDGLVSRYLDSVERQGEAVARALGGNARFARLALGGGTPTFLGPAELDRLFQILAKNFNGVSTRIPKAIEASPATVDEEKLALLTARGVTRVSVGVQSFIDCEVQSIGRPQRNEEVRRALDLVAGVKFSCMNIDLIYGAPSQTVSSWKFSVEQALEWSPQEMYLYPLYVRPLTGLDHIGRAPADNRLALYRQGRDLLLGRGYRQISMRLFRAPGYEPPDGPVYCCQEDGMIGLGAGARSYASSVHYSTEYAVGLSGVRGIIENFSGRRIDQFALADYGCELDGEEQKRRYILKSILRADGLNLGAYRERFGTDPFVDLPELSSIEEGGLGCRSGEYLRLNDRGLELSDAIGPWLFSSAVRERMEDFALS